MPLAHVPVWPLVCLLTLAAGCAPAAWQGADLAAEPFLARFDWRRPAAQWPLTGELKEVSGLTHAGDLLLAHDDNDASLWVQSRGPDAAVRLQRLPGQPHPPPDGDFEGVTVLNGVLYLLGSQGTLDRARLDPGGTSLASGFTRIGTGIEGRCNFEGLTSRPEGTLYVACKYPRQPERGTILLFRLNPRGRAPTEAHRRDALRVDALRVDVSPVLAETGLERLRPSGLAWLPEQGRLLVLAGKEHVILEVSADGMLIAWRGLPRRHHRQAEGLSVAPDGAIVIADEADGRRPTLSLYR